MKEEIVEDESYYEGESELMDTEFSEEDGSLLNHSDIKPEFAIANVSCQYDGSPGMYFFYYFWLLVKNIETSNFTDLIECRNLKFLIIYLAYNAVHQVRALTESALNRAISP